MGQPLSHQALSELIGSIYDCALAPDRWERTLAAIMAAFEGRTTALALIDLRHDRLLISRSVGIPQQMQEFAQYAAEINEFTERYYVGQHATDEPFIRSRDIPSSYVETSPYFQYRVTNGIVDTLQCFLMRTPTHYSAFSVARHEQNGVFTPREVELGGLLLPHLRRAVTISNVLDVRTIERARMAEALDALRCGVVLVNASGAVMHVNRAAEEMLQEGRALRETQGVLRAARPSAAKELSAAIGAAAEDEAGIGKRGLAIRLSEPEAAPVFAHVLPLTGSDFRTRLRPDAAAAVFIGHTPDAGDWARAVAGAFGLTPAETRLLAALLGGRRLAEAAADLGVAASTARTHLDSIFAKTGVTRQAELMRVAMQVAPPAGGA